MPSWPDETHRLDLIAVALGLLGLATITLTWLARTGDDAFAEID